MDTRDGRIYDRSEISEVDKELFRSQEKFLRMMRIPPTPRQMARKPSRVGRNEPCPCGSGKKFKRCCLGRYGK